MNQLPIFVNLKGRKVIVLGMGEMADAKRRLYARAGAEITDDEGADNVALAVVAHESDDDAVAAVARLKQAGFLVNAVDRPHLCDYTTPAIIDRDPVLIAIGTGGASAGLAKALRQRLEQLLPDSLGRLATALYAARSKIKALWPDGSDRRRAIDAALDPGASLDPMSAGAAENVAAWLDAPQGAEIDAMIELILTSNDPDDLTLKQARLLGQADQIYAEATVPDAILARARADAGQFDLSDYQTTDAYGLIL